MMTVCQILYQRYTVVIRTVPLRCLLGERTRESYQKLFDAGAERYLLRHETADEMHYRKLHPPELSWQHRKQCLYDLKEIGYRDRLRLYGGFPLSDG